MSRKTRPRPGAQRTVAGAARPPHQPAAKPGSGTAPRGLGLPLAAGALALVCCVAYWNSFRAGLILDNSQIILQDPRLRSVDWQSVRDIFTLNYWWPTGESDLFRPLTTLSYWFNYSVLGGGESPAGYHAVNLLLHWLNAVLAWLLVRGVTGRAWLALAAAAVFASHPLTVESVTNVVGRADLLAGLSILGGLCLYRQFLGAGSRRGRWWLAGLGAAYFAGVFTKESAVVLPALMLLHDIVFPPAPGLTRTATLRQSAARAWPAYASVLPGLLALVWARWAMFHDSPLFGQFGGDNPITNAPFWTAVMTAVKVAGYYLALFAWPARLSCDYSYNAITLFGWTLASGQDLHAWLALALLLALAAAAVFWWRRQPAIAFFLGLAAIAFLPTSNLLFPIGTIMAERLMYVPLVGLASAAVLMLGLAGRTLVSARPGQGPRTLEFAGVAVAAAVVVALAVRTINRNEDWTSTLRLWTSAAKAVPDSYKVHKALAFAIMQSDPSGARVDEALDQAATSMQIVERANLPLHQQPVSLYAEAGWYRLRKAQQLAGGGSTGDAQAQVGQAIALLKRAEAIDLEVNRLAREKLLGAGRRPDEIHDIGSAFLYRTLASAYLVAGDPLQAIDAAKYLQRISPEQSDAHYMRGVAEASAARFEQARNNQQAADEHLAQAAVNLIAATLLNTGDEQAWAVLANVYKYLSPDVPGVLGSGGAHALNRSNPLVASHLQSACAQLVRQIREAGMTARADAWRERLITEFGVPRESFSR
jgi:protein O-mannosyl-transferase